MMKMESIVAFSLMVVLALADRVHLQREENRESASHNHGRSRIQYDSFDDYLLDVIAPVRFDADPAEAPALSDDLNNQRNLTGPSTQDILGYFRDVPREHWSCCMLGKLAGDKGFHCHPGFYAARIQSRNYNRAHNRRMPLMHGAVRVENWGMDIMRTFQRCVLQHSTEFHKCCYAATVERREIRRWQRFRDPAH